MDEDKVETGGQTVGERLKAERTKKKLNLEDIAAQTRIPLRHLESVEQSAWDRLPAPTYTVGFAKAYAGAIGLDRAEIGEQIREELGGHRYAVSSPEVFEPADPARSMPRGLVIGAVVAVIALVLVLSWLNERSLEDTEEPVENVAAAAPPTPAPVQRQAPVAQGPVVLTATAPAWIQVTDQGKSLFSGELAPGQSFTVPATATAPLLKAGKPEALRVNVGSAVAPPVGPAGKVASNISLLATDLMRGPASAPAPAGQPQVQAQGNQAQGNSVTR
jgi:cytoskeleton protein RodZ